MAPSSTKSSTPVSVTVWAVFQLAELNVRLAGETVPSAVLLDERPIVTFAFGCELSTTVKVAVPPASVVVRPDVGVIVKPGSTTVITPSFTSAPFEMAGAINRFSVSLLVASVVDSRLIADEPSVAPAFTVRSNKNKSPT